MAFGFQPELRVVQYIATKRGDPQRGPMVRMRGADARFRMLEEGELAWVRGPRRNELAVVEIDDSIPEGGVVLRDIAGVSVSETVIVSKPDLDTSPGRQVG
ncbi:MAG TPA: hypothetical protein VIF83_04365 [Gemmatimonadaceae bacterium]